MITFTIQQVTMFLGIWMLFLIILACIVLWKDIAVFLMPYKFNKIIMLESDGNIKIWNQVKNKNNTFRFREGRYNMFTGGKLDIPKYKNERTI